MVPRPPLPGEPVSFTVTLAPTTGLCAVSYTKPEIVANVGLLGAVTLLTQPPVEVPPPPPPPPPPPQPDNKSVIAIIMLSAVPLSVSSMRGIARLLITCFCLPASRRIRDTRIKSGIYQLLHIRLRLHSVLMGAVLNTIKRTAIPGKDADAGSNTLIRCVPSHFFGLLPGGIYADLNSIQTLLGCGDSIRRGGSGSLLYGTIRRSA